VLGRGRLSARLAPLGRPAVLLATVVHPVLRRDEFGVWLGFATYETSWSGLGECYVAAIPSPLHAGRDLFFATVLFGSYALALSLAPAPQPAAETN